MQPRSPQQVNWVLSLVYCNCAKNGVGTTFKERSSRCVTPLILLWRLRSYCEEEIDLNQLCKCGRSWLWKAERSRSSEGGRRNELLLEVKLISRDLIHLFSLQNV